METFAVPLITKYPEVLFEKENATLNDHEHKCIHYYKKFMRDDILDMIAMEII